MTRSAVVDADVGRSASESGAAKARSALEALTQLASASDVVVLMEGELLAEWDKHRSRFGLTWLTKLMTAKRLLSVVAAPDTSAEVDTVLRSALAASDPSAYKARAKDAHLICVAIDNGAAIVSMDKKSRNGYRSLCHLNPPWSDVGYFCLPDHDGELAGWCAEIGAVAPTLC